MLEKIRALRHSLFAQIIGVVLAAHLVLVIFIVVSLQTTALSRILPRAFTNFAEPVSELVYLIETVDTAGEASVLSVFNDAAKRARIEKGFPDNASVRPNLYARLISFSPQMEKIFQNREVRFRYLAPHTLFGEKQRAFQDFQALAVLEISVSLADGRVLSVMVSPAAIMVNRPWGFITLLVPVILLTASIAVVFIAQALKPLRELEHAAHRFGERPGAAPVAERGAEEIRRVARALNRTQARVNTLISERVQMVSAITHDLRTTITRLRLRLDRPGEINRDAFDDDLDQMQALIDDVLTYARSGQPSAERDLIELNDFVSKYALAAPGQLSLEIGADPDGFLVAADPGALTRALNNIVDNAGRYGRNTTLRTEHRDGDFFISVLDDGPGVPEDKLQDLFKPFFRLESSRSRETGGSGLGLGIAQGLIEAKGGELSLQNRPTGGLCVTIRFPAGCHVE